jgi:hypothetical protein
MPTYLNHFIAAVAIHGLAACGGAGSEVTDDSLQEAPSGIGINTGSSNG